MPQYGQYGGAPAPQNSGKAVGALVCGIAGLVVCQPVGIAGIVLARQADEEIAASGGRLTGQGLAQAGRILGWISVALMVLSVIVITIIVAAAAGSGS